MRLLLSARFLAADTVRRDGRTTILHCPMGDVSGRLRRTGVERRLSGARNSVRLVLRAPAAAEGSAPLCGLVCIYGGAYRSRSTAGRRPLHAVLGLARVPDTGNVLRMGLRTGLAQSCWRSFVVSPLRSHGAAGSRSDQLRGLQTAAAADRKSVV